MNKSKFIVITGPDGSGKKIQTGLLVERLKSNGYPVVTIDFPQYERNFFGNLVGRYLKGDFGEADKVSPYLASVLYACDRFESSEYIKYCLENGSNVVADRYVTDNQIHQGGKIADQAKRKELLDWQEKMEFGVFRIPRPDALVYLDVPLEISLELLKNKEAKERKSYLAGEKDGHENREHLERARKCAEYLDSNNIHHNNKSWIWIDCAPKGSLLPKEEISNMIWKKVQPILIF